MFMITHNARVLAQRHLSWLEEVVCVVWRITYLYLRQKRVLSDVCDLARVEFFTLRNASLG